MRYTLQTFYHATVELEVEVPDGLDPKDPQNWAEIVSEQQLDYQLYDVESAEETQ